MSLCSEQHSSQELRKLKCPRRMAYEQKVMCTHNWNIIPAKRKEIPQYATTQMNLEDTRLCETIQAQKDTSQTLTRTGSLKAARLREQVHGPPGAGRGQGEELLFRGVAFILRDAKGRADGGGDLHSNMGVCYHRTAHFPRASG